MSSTPKPRRRWFPNPFDLVFAVVATVLLGAACVILGLMSLTARRAPELARTR